MDTALLFHFLLSFNIFILNLILTDGNTAAPAQYFLVYLGLYFIFNFSKLFLILYNIVFYFNAPSFLFYYIFLFSLIFMSVHMCLYF